MTDPATSSTAVDLSRLPAPTIIAQLSFEQIYAAILADAQARLAAAGVTFDATVESDPAVKLLQAAAYRELLLRQAFDDAARQLLVAYATGANLDQLAALVGVARLVVTPADPETGAEAVSEADVALRQRIVLAPESFSVAGPELAYVFHAKSASGNVADASAISPAPGEVLVSLLAVDGDGAADQVTIDAVSAVLATVGGNTVRPLGDAVTVASAQIVDFAIEATLYTFSGPDRDLVVQTARDRLDAFLAENRRLGRDITTSGIIGALMVAGVQRAVLASPAADVTCNATQAAHPTAITIVHGGYGD